jgi:hypothetical protein
MPRRRQPGHIYSVFVSTVTSEATMATEMVYFGDSEFAAQLTLAKAIMNYPHVYAVEVRCDLRLLVRVKVERPSLPSPGEPHAASDDIR